MITDPITIPRNKYHPHTIVGWSVANNENQISMNSTYSSGMNSNMGNMFVGCRIVMNVTDMKKLMEMNSDH